MRPKKARRRAKKAGTKTGALVPQQHGGAIFQGTPATIVPGPGRPPSAIRERLRGSFDQRVQILEEIADGKAVQTVKIGEKETKTEVAASPSDRLKAIDMLAKYGLGEKNEVTLVHPEVQERLARQANLIASQPTWDSNELLNRLGAEVWR